MGRPTVFREHTGMLTTLLPLVDALTTVGSALIAWLFLATLPSGVYPEQIPLQFFYAIVVATVLVPSCFSWAGLYRPWRGRNILGEVRGLIFAWSFVFLLLAALALLTQSGGAFSRLWLGVWYLTGLAGFVLGRITVRAILRNLRRNGYDQKRIVLIGAGELSRSVIEHLNSHPWAGIQVMGVFDEKGSGLREIDGVPVLGAVEDLLTFLGSSENRINQVWLALPLSEEQQLAQLLARLRSTGVDVCFVPDIFGMRMLQNEMLNIAGLPVMNLTASPITGFNKAIKEIEDKVLASIILVMISPLMLLIALGIKFTSSGPILYRQMRHGWDGRNIEIYKFRTMYWGEQAEEGGFRQATRNDRRITSIGAFLRQTSLDELPQFINVLQGRMSVVGPRPHAIEHNAAFEGQVDRYRLRHKVKPGITGWAQVNGFRGETDTLYKMKKRVEYDLFYIENWSFLFDVKIVFLTVLKGFVNKNAY